MSNSEPSPDANLAEQLQRLLQAIEASSYAVLPSTDLDLLQSVVEAAATIFGAEAASIALVDNEYEDPPPVPLPTMPPPDRPAPSPPATEDDSDIVK